MTILQSIDDLHSKTNISCNKIKLIGDKGYISTIENKNILLDYYNTEIIFPHRKNQKVKQVLLIRNYLTKDISSKMLIVVLK